MMSVALRDATGSFAMARSRVVCRWRGEDISCRFCSVLPGGFLCQLCFVLLQLVDGG